MDPFNDQSLNTTQLQEGGIVTFIHSTYYFEKDLGHSLQRLGLPNYGIIGEWSLESAVIATPVFTGLRTERQKVHFPAVL